MTKKTETIISPLFNDEGFSIKESFVAAEVNLMSEGTPSFNSPYF